MHTYNTRSNKRYALNAEIAEKAQAQGHRVEVAISDTGKGIHLRWQWSEQSIGGSDGDSSSSDSSLSSLSDTSDATDSVDGDGDSQMGDEERMRTPLREVPYDPGSVVLTPKKGRGLRHEPRVGGGFDFWHEQDGVEQRLAFSPDGASFAPASSQDLGPTTEEVRDAVEDYRRRHPLMRRQSTVLVLDDDASSVVSDATVIIDPRATPEPTLFDNRAMPLVRQPTLPADYDLNSRSQHPRARADRLSTIQEDAEAEPQWPPRVPEWTGMRILRDANGKWVREGSLGPDADYQINRQDLPPRIDVAQNPAPSGSNTRTRAAPLRRTDTEPVLDVPAQQRAR